MHEETDLRPPRVNGAFSMVGGPAADPEAPYVRLAAVGLVGSEDGGRWLLLHRTEPSDSWDPPGGRMERTEDLTEAVMREVAEETGLPIGVAGPCYAHLAMYKGERLLAVSMSCRSLGDPDQVRLEPGGAIDWRWVLDEEWLALAEERLTSWSKDDVRKATCAARAVWAMAVS